jgi:hypothetical protein
MDWVCGHCADTVIGARRTDPIVPVAGIAAEIEFAGSDFEMEADSESGTDAGTTMGW